MTAKARFEQHCADPEAIRGWFAEGRSRSDIAAMVGVTVPTVNNVVMNRSFPDPDYQPPRSLMRVISAEDLAEARRAHAEGVSMAELGVRYGVAYRTMWDLVAAKGRRQRGPSRLGRGGAA